MKITTVVGARPQFVKAAAVSRAVRDHNVNFPSSSIEEAILHTGQHYDENMSQVFFDELDIPRPEYNLEISGGLHGAMTGKMLEGIEHVLVDERPDLVLVYGDTNSTLAGALAAAKLHIPVVHVEAGLRSFNMRMPEEINRILTDRISNFLFCPTNTAVANLKNEGVTSGIHNVGDVMFDAALFYGELSKRRSEILRKLSLEDKGYVLSTFHRAENTDDETRLTGILKGLSQIAEETKVILPLHPRTRKTIEQKELSRYLNRITVTPPVSFLDMIRLEQSAEAILTDSGGVQKEAYFFRVPCITLREETEWVETISAHANTLVGASSEKISKTFNALKKEAKESVNWESGVFGKGQASGEIIDHLIRTV